MYRVWYSTESFADFIIDHTQLRHFPVTKCKLYESDANNPQRFHTIPDHIRKILYLDAPDLIVEKDNEPVFSMEVTTEAGTGHNAFQRFARMAAAAENHVPAFYIYPEGKLISRKSASLKWDEINPLIFRALEAVMSIYFIPALLYYFPSDFVHYRAAPASAPHLASQGLCFDPDLVHYAGCPDSSAPCIHDLFAALDELLRETERVGVQSARSLLLSNLVIRNQRNAMQNEFVVKANSRSARDMSPLSAVQEVPTEYLLNYLAAYESTNYKIGELLRNRPTTALYQVNAAFRGDPYPGCLAAIDYLICRQGQTFEERRLNLVMVWGRVTVDHAHRTLLVANEHGSTIQDFFKAVQQCTRLSLLSQNYGDLHSRDIPRYLMQVRYGSTYSKSKHIRVYSYFADALLFPDGALWRDG